MATPPRPPPRISYRIHHTTLSEISGGELIAVDIVVEQRNSDDDDNNNNNDD